MKKLVKVMKEILRQLHYSNKVAYYELLMKYPQTRTGDPDPPDPPPDPPSDD